MVGGICHSSLVLSGSVWTYLSNFFWLILIDRLNTARRVGRDIVSNLDLKINRRGKYKLLLKPRATD